MPGHYLIWLRLSFRVSFCSGEIFSDFDWNLIRKKKAIIHTMNDPTPNKAAAPGISD